VTYEWVMWHMNESCDIWMSHVTYEWVMWHMNESCDIWMSPGLFLSNLRNQAHVVRGVTPVAGSNFSGESLHSRIFFSEFFFPNAEEKFGKSRLFSEETLMMRPALRDIFFDPFVSETWLIAMTNDSLGPWLDMGWLRLVGALKS